VKLRHLSWAGFLLAGYGIFTVLRGGYVDWRQENQRRFDEAGAILIQDAGSLPEPRTLSDGGWVLVAVGCWFDWGPHPPAELFPDGASVVYGDGRKAWCWGFVPSGIKLRQGSPIVWESPRGEPGTCEKLQEFPEQWQPIGYGGCE
jgi:hypothetical protein